MAAVTVLHPRALVSFSGTASPGLLALAREGPDPAAVLGSICRQVGHPTALTSTLLHPRCRSLQVPSPIPGLLGQLKLHSNPSS